MYIYIDLQFLLLLPLVDFKGELFHPCSLVLLQLFFCDEL